MLKIFAVSEFFTIFAVAIDRNNCPSLNNHNQNTFLQPHINKNVRSN